MRQRSGTRAMNSSGHTGDKVVPERSSQGQNTCRGNPGRSGPRRGAWKRKGGYPKKSAFKRHPKEGLHPAGTSRNKNVLGIGTEALALTVDQETESRKDRHLHQRFSHCPGKEGLQRQSMLHDMIEGRTNEPGNWARVSSTAQCLGKWIHHVLSGAFYSAPFGGRDGEQRTTRIGRTAAALRQLPGAAVRKFHKLCGLNNTLIVSHVSGS